MKPIQIFALVAALAANGPAQTSGQNTGPAASPTPKSQSQQQTGANSKKKDSKKPDAASGKTSGGSGQPGSIKVIIPPAQATTPASKNAGAKPQTPAATASKAPAGTKSSAPATGASQDTAKKTAGAASGKGAQPATTVQKKQPVPVLAVKPSSKPAQVKKSASTGSTRKSGAGSGPFAGKTSEPKIIQKTPPKGSLVATAKTTAKISSAGRRDPFVNPIRSVSTSPAVPPVLNCSTGKKGLTIADLTVQGTARDTDGKMMAIVASGNHRAYFLRENDQICNGGVQKITGDSVIFRESVTDNAGHQATHEVVKKINPS